jgi:small-conductance mechanosensitive channel
MGSIHVRHTWFFVIFLFCSAFVLANVVHYLLFRFKGKKREYSGVRLAVRRHVAKPARAIFVLTCLLISLPFVPVVSNRVRDFGEHTLILALVASLGWLAGGFVYVFEAIVLRKYDLTAKDNVQARKVHTQFQIIRRLAIGFVVVITAAALLWTFNDPRIWQYGTGLLASAGVASLLLATAAKSTASNVLAGIQIAFTGMIRIDDAVVVQGESARVEEITNSYVVLRMWDLRRLIVPLSYFIENPFYNLSRERTDLTGVAFLYLDYTIPVEEVRRQLESIVASSELWDGQVCRLQVTNLTDRTMEMRCGISAADSSRAFDLACVVRERMVEWVRESYPAAFPTMRFAMAADAKGGHAAGFIPSR